MSPPTNTERDKELRKLFRTSGLSMRMIGERYGITYQRVSQICDGLKRDRARDKTTHPNYQGDRFICPKTGHVMVRNRHGKPIRECYVVWKKHHGRRSDRVITHLDGDKTNNAIENLHGGPTAGIRWEPEELIRGLRWLAISLNHTPSGKAITETEAPIYHMAYHRVFGTLTKAQYLAGLTPNERGRAAALLPYGFREQYEHYLQLYASFEDACVGWTRGVEMGKKLCTYYRDRRSNTWLVWIPQQHRQGEHLTVDIRRKDGKVDRRHVSVVSSHRRHSLAAPTRREAPSTSIPPQDEKPRPRQSVEERKTAMIAAWRQRQSDKKNATR